MGYNLLTGAGFDMGFGGSYGMAWLGLVVLTFIIMCVNIGYTLLGCK